MAAVTLLGTQTFDTASGTKTVTATPAVGDLIIIITAHTGNISSAVPTDNQGGTYSTASAFSRKAAGADTMFMWVRDSLVASSVSTIYTHAPGTSTGGGLAVLKVTGMSLAGASAVAQSAVRSNQAAAGTPNPALSALPSAANPIIGAVFNATSPATMTPRTGYTERVDVGFATPTTGLEVMTRDSGETSNVITWGGTSASAYGAIAIELNAPVPPGGNTTNFFQFM